MKKSYFYIILAAILWGTTGTSQSFLTGAHPLSVGAIRLLIGGGGLLIYDIIKYGWTKDFNKFHLFLTSLAIAIYQPLFFMGVKLAGVAFATVLAIGSAPIFSGVIEYLCKRPLSKSWLIGTLLSLIGCLSLFAGRIIGDISILGALLALGAGLSYAMYVYFSRKLIDAGSKHTTSKVFFLGGLILLPLLLLVDVSWMTKVSNIMLMIHLGLIATGLSYTLFVRGLKHVSSPEAVTLSLIEPLTASLLGVFVLKESLSPLELSGMLLLIIGLLISSRPSRSEVMEKIYKCPDCDSELEAQISCGSESYFCKSCKKLISRKKIKGHPNYEVTS
ncbi:EamA family transporter [Acidaminobacter sp. JC074]|uniref:YfgJ family double zinc ribbon protein n=1 Tax=Acidaminobacter sp. JC074 TaxID=2530199 RepID=UPI001F0D8F2B|nr:zinc-ribbon domain-containing protein [Acidaminobacter sp. JC074]MCH4887774.1 EamA family transporter [Acidaminobacter sp. JC074]